MIFTIRGDGSYLGLLDLSYKGYVGPNWADSPKLLEPHFIEQMQSFSGLFWDSGIETDWVVEVTKEKVQISGFREIVGSIKVTDGKLYLVEYDLLTKLAQFKEASLTTYDNDNCINLENGNYKVRIIQLKDPKYYFPDGKSTDFIIEITKSNALSAPWQSVAWSDL